MGTQPTLKEHAFIVFVVNKWDLAIPGAEVSILIGDIPIASATLQGYSDTPIRVQVSENVTEVALRATVHASEALRLQQTVTRTANVSVDVGKYRFKLDEVPMPEPPPPAVPTWFQPAGFVCGVLTLAFFMWMRLMKGGEPPSFADQAILSLGVALAAGFIGGHAAANGNIPFFQNSPLVITVGGGMAAFVITFVLVRQLAVGGGPLPPVTPAPEASASASPSQVASPSAPASASSPPAAVSPAP